MPTNYNGKLVIKLNFLVRILRKFIGAFRISLCKSSYLLLDYCYICRQSKLLSNYNFIPNLDKTIFSYCHIDEHILCIRTDSLIKCDRYYISLIDHISIGSDDLSYKSDISILLNRYNLDSI